MDLRQYIESRIVELEQMIIKLRRMDEEEEECSDYIDDRITIHSACILELKEVLRRI